MEDVGDDDLVTLAEACELFFRGRLTKSSLRREASRGNLEIIRIANKDFVTRNGIRTMIDKCRLPVREEKSAQPRSVGITAQEALRIKIAKMKEIYAAEARQKADERREERRKDAELFKKVQALKKSGRGYPSTTK